MDQGGADDDIARNADEIDQRRHQHEPAAEPQKRPQYADTEADNDDGQDGNIEA